MNDCFNRDTCLPPMLHIAMDTSGTALITESKNERID